MTRELWAKQMATRILHKHGPILKNWRPQWHLEIWLRDECRCVYCRRNLLQERDIAYFFYHYDHILPQSRHPALQDAIWNKVLACHACNVWKHEFDPSFGGFGITRTEAIPPTEEYRDKLIERARIYIQVQKGPEEALFAQEREIIIAALGEYESGMAASVKGTE
jgi:hypothetical protein